MKAILSALKSAIPAGISAIKKCGVLPDPDILPQGVEFPYAGLKDGDTSRTEGMGQTVSEVKSVLIYVYVQILKEEASVMGDGSKKGVLDLMQDLVNLLDWNALGGIVSHAFCSEIMASETFMTGENVFIQRKGCRYTYQIE